MNYFFEAKVLEVRPNAHYRGISYDQEVVFELKNGQNLSFFDQASQVKKEMEGTAIRIHASCLSENLEKSLEKEYSIKQTIPTHASVKGKIIELKTKKLDGKNYLFGVVDAGAAKFEFSIPDLGKFKKRDFIVFNETKNNYNRIDILEIKLKRQKGRK